MALLLTVLAAITAMGAGIALFAFARTRPRASRIRHLTASEGSTPALPPSRLPEDLLDLLARSRALRIELDALALHGEQVAVLDDTLDLHLRRPLWHRLEGASYDYTAERAGAGLHEWIDRHDRLGPEAREVLRTLELGADELRALLGCGLTGGGQHPTDFSSELEQARAALRRHEAELARHDPRGYR